MTKEYKTFKEEHYCKPGWKLADNHGRLMFLYGMEVEEQYAKELFNAHAETCDVCKVYELKPAITA